MIKNLPIKVDEVGRVVIPKKIRNIWNINNKDYLYLTFKNDNILISKQSSDSNLDKLIKKVRVIENLFKVSVVIAESNKVVWTSEKYKEKGEIEIKKVIDEIAPITIVSDYLKYYVYIITEIKEKDNVLNDIENLLS